MSAKPGSSQGERIDRAARVRSVPIGHHPGGAVAGPLEAALAHRAGPRHCRQPAGRRRRRQCRRRARPPGRLKRSAITTRLARSHQAVSRPSWGGAGTRRGSASKSRTATRRPVADHEADARLVRQALVVEPAVEQQHPVEVHRELAAVVDHLQRARGGRLQPRRPVGHHRPAVGAQRPGAERQLRPVRRDDDPERALRPGRATRARPGRRARTPARCRRRGARARPAPPLRSPPSRHLGVTAPAAPARVRADVPAAWRSASPSTTCQTGPSPARQAPSSSARSGSATSAHGGEVGDDLRRHQRDPAGDLVAHLAVDRLGQPPEHDGSSRRRGRWPPGAAPAAWPCRRRPAPSRRSRPRPAPAGRPGT